MLISIVEYFVIDFGYFVYFPYPDGQKTTKALFVAPKTHYSRMFLFLIRPINLPNNIRLTVRRMRNVCVSEDFNEYK